MLGAAAATRRGEELLDREVRLLGLRGQSRRLALPPCVSQRRMAAASVSRTAPSAGGVLLLVIEQARALDGGGEQVAQDLVDVAVGGAELEDEEPRAPPRGRAAAPR